MSAIGNAIKSIGKGIGDTLGAAGDLLGNVAKLNFSGALCSATDLATSGLGLAGSVTELHPSALAANLLMDGATDLLSSSPLNKPDER